MNVFLLPSNTCKELERLMAKFWWHSDSSSGKVSFGVVFLKQIKDLIHTCAQRTIASGKNVSILNDPWLPHNSNKYVVSRNPTLVNNSASCLFQVGTRAWDEDVMRDLFVARDQDLILSIQLSHSAANNGWSWRLETCGNYSISNFLWRAASGVLPTCFQLQKRHVPVNADCPLCNPSTETIQHALVENSFAKAAWHRSIVDVGAGAATFNSWLFRISIRGHEFEMEEVAMVSWAIWRARNDFVWQKKSWLASNIITSARTILDQYKFAQGRKGLSLSPLNDGGGTVSVRLHLC
ncbi:uncharacterized protein LOC133038499 [Cannabis sativa]|uniref:uncharacterized protein LOC133038499 n=1 Tax=Cannabis sativa TaxID=3483 RepID=UPI0029C9B97A|nr:uncharacterized protein LOC133038499 [Cannabis sativa]